MYVANCSSRMVVGLPAATQNRQTCQSGHQPRRLRPCPWSLIPYLERCRPSLLQACTERTLLLSQQPATCTPSPSCQGSGANIRHYYTRPSLIAGRFKNPCRMIIVFEPANRCSRSQLGKGRRSPTDPYAAHFGFTCRIAPIPTSRVRGAAVVGCKYARVMHPTKKGTPVQQRKFGVALATPFQPNRLKIQADTSIMEPVTIPVHIATSPMNACKRILTGQDKTAPLP